MKGVVFMKLKPTKKLKPVMQEEPKEVSTPKKREKKGNKLPSDEYKPMFPPNRFLVRESFSQKDPTKVIKQYMEISVKRFDDDEAPPCVWIQMYQESEFYTGYLKGKTVYLPLDALNDLIDGLADLSEECDNLGIE